MYVKGKVCLIVCVSCFISFLSGLQVSAKEESPKGLPAVIRWEEGNGYDSDGKQITGGWAYDTVNEAGKYVLFDENGMVQQRAESWKNRDNMDEYFTPTEQETATIALRLELFDGFEGETLVMIESGDGAFEKYLLSSENLFEFNIPVHSGIYQVQKVEAADSQYIYAAEYDREQFWVEEQGLCLFPIKVTNQKTGEVQSGNINSQTKTYPDEEREEVQLESENPSSVKRAGEGRTGREYKSQKNFLIGAGIILLLVAELLVRNKKSQYH